MQQMTQILTGSYSSEDVVFLLKDLSDASLERSLNEREEAIQGGAHYSEMLPIEYEPTEAYLNLFYESLHTSKRKVATAVGAVSELLIEKKGKELVLVSLARAGTPIGILMKRYIKAVYGANLPHYSVSIIRGRGIDENAMLYITSQHPDKRIVFVDGWTGKGAISIELTKSVELFKEKHGIMLDDELVVLADPGSLFFLIWDAGGFSNPKRLFEFNSIRPGQPHGSEQPLDRCDGFPRSESLFRTSR